MQKKVQKLTRENYQVPKGEERLVHYLQERVSFNKATGEKESHPDLNKTGLKMFDMVKRNLELQGYTINILYHPLNQYNEWVEVESPMAVKEQELADAQREIEELKAELAKSKAEGKAESKKKTK